MKNWLITGLCLMLIALSACATGNQNQNQSGNNTTTEESQQVSTVEESEEPVDVPVAPPVADAAQYRGVITEMEDSDGNTVLTLQQVTGTDFGHEELKVVVSENTSAADDLEFAQGQYVEVYYGGQPDDADGVQAISLQVLPDAALAVFNGSLVELTADDDDSGSMLLEAEDGNQILFHYTDETQFYLDREALKEGDRLSVYSDGTSTRSIPPQANALEVRPFAGS